MILRGSIRDGEVARVEYDNGKIVVLPNHAESDLEDDEDMIDDEEDAIEEIVPDEMDEDIYN